MTYRDQQAVRYVVAVSGGVDSVALLHIMAQHMSARQLVVAHFDHGIRSDSAQDRQLVEALAQQYGVTFVYEEGRLGNASSEAQARDARYAFLQRVRQAHGADFIVTAHHEDDLLETAIINMLRGTGRKGLSSLRSHGQLYRPLLPTPKAHIVTYARKHGLQWREDSTNASQDYFRNYVRLQIMPRFDHEARRRLRGLIGDTQQTNLAIDDLLAQQLQLQTANQLNRQWFIMLPHAVAKEIMATWLRQNGVADFDRKLLERLTIVAKTLAIGKQMDINRALVMVVSKEVLSVEPRVTVQRRHDS